MLRFKQDVSIFDKPEIFII